MSKHFLIVDDDERFAHLMKKRLAKHASCVISTNGKDALLHFERRLRSNTPFTAVFMDIEMPSLSGHEVATRMRTIEEKCGIQPAHEFKLVMVSAYRDVKNVSTSFFRDRADAFIPKECVTETLDCELSKVHLI